MGYANQTGDNTARPFPDWRVVPLVPGTKRAKGKWDKCTMRINELVRRSSEFAPYDIGVLLKENSLVLVDADTEQGAYVPGADGTARLVPGADGPANLREWKAANPGALPATYYELSPGDPGRHGRGEHYLYKQNPEEPVTGAWRPLPGVDFKSSGIMRIRCSGSPLTEIITLTDPVTIPAQTVRAFKAMRTKSTRSGGKRSGGGTGDGTGQDDMLFRLARSLKSSGLDSETAYVAWRAIADTLPLKDPAWPWTREDFERHFRDMDDAEPQVQNRRSNNVSSNTTGHTDIHGGNTTGQTGNQGSNQSPDRLSPYDPSWMPRPIEGKNADQLIRRIDAKLKAESHVSALVNDWSKLPDSYHPFYMHTALRVRAGSLTRADDPWLLSKAPPGALSTLSSKVHPLLADLGGHVVLLADTTPPDGKEYPGWGNRSTDGLAQVPYKVADDITLMILVSAGKAPCKACPDCTAGKKCDKGKPISDGYVAFIANADGFRSKYGLQQFMPWGRRTVQRARKRLLDAGLMAEKPGQGAVRTHKDHRWQYTPPVYMATQPGSRAHGATQDDPPEQERRPARPIDLNPVHGRECPVCAPMYAWLDKVTANTRAQRESRNREREERRQARSEQKTRSKQKSAA